ncbi:pentapeptide repeat-containing protein [Actinoplanes sp. NPDC048967]|uniref:pentapeptide repeat-containing protein n=1 Tax=Actinoplanes sp. NPDC048967 TaxID=3155269 RepID=UPI0033CDE6B7
MVAFALCIIVAVTAVGRLLDRPARLRAAAGCTIATGALIAVTFTPAGLLPGQSRRSEAVDLRGRQISPATAAALSLRGALLDGAQLDDRDLRSNSLAGASATGASLVRARLDNVNLRGADLRGADMSRACLRGADLTGAILTGVRIDGADVTDATLPVDAYSAWVGTTSSTTTTTVGPCAGYVARQGEKR